LPDLEDRAIGGLDVRMTLRCAKPSAIGSRGDNPLSAEIFISAGSSLRAGFGVNSISPHLRQNAQMLLLRDVLIAEEYQRFPAARDGSRPWGG